MMQVQEYLQEHGLLKLQEEFAIMVSDYEDRVVLNYNQIESPRFHPICDECRALILRKSDFSVMARSFDRFYNVGEGEAWKDFPISKAKFLEKLDGSIMSLYWDGEEWCVSTRKMAFAEGKLPCGITFRQLFNKAAEGTNLWNWLEETPLDAKSITFVFELTAPENRVVTPYTDRKITLIGARNNRTGIEGRSRALDVIAVEMGVGRPKYYEFSTMEEVIEAAEKLGTMDEGFVLVAETGDIYYKVGEKTVEGWPQPIVADPNIIGQGSHRRLKCKNPKFVAIAHMRENGGISPKRILTLVMANEEAEYLSYFPEDKKYFDFVRKQYDELTERLTSLWFEVQDIEEQKDFALTMIPKTHYPFEKGVLFNRRKGTCIYKGLQNIGAKKIAKQMDLNKKMTSVFGIDVEESD